MNLEPQLREHFVRTYPAEAALLVAQRPETADELGELSVTALASLLDHLDPGLQLQVFSRQDTARQARLLEHTGIRTALYILRSLDPEERSRALEDMSERVRGEYLELLEYPERTAGRYMDWVVNRYTPDQTVGEALDLLRSSGAQRIRSLYVVTDDDAVAGRVDIQDMALADPMTPMASLLHPVDQVAQLTSTEEDLVELFDRTRLDSIPVVDIEQKLIGVVRYNNLIQAAEEAATAGLQRMVGVSADERALSTPLFAVKRRLLWLHINLLTAFLAAAVVGLFESTIAQFTALAILLPVVAGQSGNAGSQALAVTMRGLALREISTLQWPAVLNKEVQIGIINGTTLALTCGLGVWVWSQSWGLALVIAIAMVTAMIMAGISGALVPIALSRLGQDPATASSIILTTVTDVSGFLAFLGTATLLAGLL